MLAVGGRELSRAATVEAGAADAPSAAAAATDDLYGGGYFGVGRDPSGDRQGLSGYASYDRVSSNADITAYLLWRNFRLVRSLDVGCATGYVVEALRERGIDAEGCDVSQFAVDHAAPGAVGHLRLGDLSTGLTYDDSSFDLVSTLEVLEHLPPAQVPGALREVRRVGRGFVYATIPSFGVNDGGPDGHLEGKVRPERLEHYRSLGAAFEGPVPEEDLEVDAAGVPIEGHLCIASYRWWTARFAEAGFERRLDLERRLHRDLEPTGLNDHWNVYVFALPGTSEEWAAPLRPEASLAELGLVHPLLG